VNPYKIDLLTPEYSPKLYKWPLNIMDMPSACNCVIGLEMDVLQNVFTVVICGKTHTHILGLTVQNYILLTLYSCFDIKIRETSFTFCLKIYHCRYCFVVVILPCAMFCGHCCICCGKRWSLMQVIFYQLSEHDSCRVTLQLKAQKTCFMFIHYLTFIGYADQ